MLHFLVARGHHGGAIKTTWLPSVLLANAYSLQFAYVCSQQMSFNQTDVRANTPARPSGNMDRDREVLRLPHSGAARVEERSLTTSGDGWEKTKMKKERSGGIKPDVSPSTVAPKPIDGYREPRQGL